MTVKELILASRSYRSFDRSVPLTREQLVRFAESARYCPSTRNLQALKFRIVSSEEECNAVLPLTRWAGLIKDMKIPPDGHEPTGYIVVCTDSRLTDSPVPFQRDVGICAQSILLTATEAGFGGCMIGSFQPDGISRVLSLPEYLLPQLVIALGKPDETVKLTDAVDGNVAYYRENGIHYVPKRASGELIV